MGIARAIAVLAAITGVFLAGCGAIPLNRQSILVAQAPAPLRAVLEMRYNAGDTDAILRFRRNGQTVYHVQMSGGNGRPVWVEFNPAGDELAHGA